MTSIILLVLFFGGFVAYIAHNKRKVRELESKIHNE